jgi:hypothetical protein
VPSLTWTWWSSQARCSRSSARTERFSLDTGQNYDRSLYPPLWRPSPSRKRRPASPNSPTELPASTITSPSPVPRRLRRWRYRRRRAGPRRAGAAAARDTVISDPQASQPEAERPYTVIFSRQARRNPHENLPLGVAAIPATRQPTLTSGYTPVLAAIATCRATRACSPARSASAMTGTSPPRDARSGSSKVAEPAAGGAAIASARCPSGLAHRSFRHSRCPSSEGIFWFAAPYRRIQARGLRLSLDPPPECGSSTARRTGKCPLNWDNGSV